MVRVSWPSYRNGGQALPLRPKENPTIPTVDIYPFGSTDGLIVKVQPPIDHPNPKLHHVPCDIVLVIDVSGSMCANAPIPGAEGEVLGLSVLDLTKHAALTILETLGERDRLGIVTFASDVEVSEHPYAKLSSCMTLIGHSLRWYKNWYE